MKSIIIIQLLLCIVYGFSFTNAMCLRSSNCDPTEYCDRDFPNPLGKCKQGSDNGEACVLDKYCASKRCKLFKCVGREQIRDGLCRKELKSADCPENQRCKEVSDDRYECVNRKCLGWCKRNTDCMSNKCHLFVCVKSEDKGC